MSFASCFYAKTKTYKLLIEEGTSGLPFVERSRRVSRVVYMGKPSLVWLLATTEEMLKGENLSEFYRASRVDSRAYIAQKVHKQSWVVLGIVGIWGRGSREASLLFRRLRR